ncbi:MAG: hypothetical protein AAF636_12955 [Pseudomonadota bacterium]
MSNKIENLSKCSGGHTAVDGTSAVVPKSAFLALSARQVAVKVAAVDCRVENAGRTND